MLLLPPPPPSLLTSLRAFARANNNNRHADESTLSGQARRCSLRSLLLLLLRSHGDCHVQGAWADGADARACQEQAYARAHALRAPLCVLT